MPTQRFYKDSQNDEDFNKFEVPDTLALEEGIPVDVYSGATSMGMDFVQEQENTFLILVVVL